MVSRPITHPVSNQPALLRWATFSSLLLLLLGSHARGELNLSPKVEKFHLDGVKMWHLEFETGLNQKASYRPPAGWLYSGSTNQLVLQPPGKNQAQVGITKTALQKPAPLNEETRKKLAAEALASLPEGSEQPKIESEEANSLRLSGNDSHFLQLSYVFYGEKFSRYCLLLDCKTYQLRFQLTCREGDYKELSRAFQKSLYSWQHL
jgi:hypothetical protein